MNIKHKNIIIFKSRKQIDEYLNRDIKYGIGENYV